MKTMNIFKMNCINSDNYFVYSKKSFYNLTNNFFTIKMVYEQIKH